MSARIAAAVAAVVVLGAACGSDATEPADAPPAPGTAASAEPSAAAEAAPSPTGDSAAAPPEVPPQPATPPVPQPQAAPSAQPAPPPQPQVHLDTSGARTFPAPEVWEALRQCQSQGDYRFVHPSGQYFGAYQFTVATWDRLASQRYTHLLGVLPSEADPADQDRMAYYLWIESGHARWPACSHVFTGDPPTEAAATVTGGGASPPPAAVPGGSASAEADPNPSPDGTTGETATSGTDGTTAQPDTGPPVTTTTALADLPQLEIDPSVQPAVPPDVPGFPTEEQWEALRMCESSGNYRAVSRNRLYYGAYQFWPDTWDFVARRNYPRLEGVLPSNATPQDQTRMAYRLWEERGDQPWPICGRHLRPGA